MLKIGILVYDGVEELDFAGPWESMAYVNKIVEKSVKMYSIGTKKEIRAYNGLKITADETIYTAPQMDILVIPGGRGRKTEMKNEDTLRFIRHQYLGLKYLLSVCTGAFLIAATGLLDGRSATTHKYAIQELMTYPRIKVVEKRIVKSENIITAAGITAGIDLGLYMIDTIFGRDIALKISEHLEYQSKELEEKSF